MVLAGVTAFLLSYFKPALLLSSTITAGGDTPSHYFTLKFLVENLLPQGRLTGWTMANYAGFPLLEFYFPLPFLCMAVFSVLVGLPVAFKLGTVLGIFLLPPCAYVGVRRMGFAFPAPALAAACTLPFLFHEGYSIWGGNLGSTLAGEFAYSLSLALMMAWMGNFYDGIQRGRGVIANAVWIALIGMSHGYTLLLAGVFSLLALLDRRRFVEHLVYLFKMHGLGILLMSVWLVPMLAHGRWTTPYNPPLGIANWKELLPEMMWPLLILAPFALWRAPRPVWWIAAWIPITGMLYGIAPAIGVVDIRFLPPAQLAAALLTAIGLARVAQRWRGNVLWPLIVLGVIVWGIDLRSKVPSGWIKWNYEGFETKSGWPVFKTIQDALQGGPNDPRVIYEHSSRHNDIGTLRAWEMLPLFSGRSTLEHAYFQASPNAPFVFYLQSLVSKEISCPFWDYGCTDLDYKAAEPRLRLFNVREAVVVSEEARRSIRQAGTYTLQGTYPPYDVYRLNGDFRYVEPLAYTPVLWTGGHWQQTAYRWFRTRELLPVHLVFPEGGSDKDHQRFALRSGDLDHIPWEARFYSGSVRSESVTENEITFETDAIGQPHLIKVSYHPGWRVEGAAQIYLVSPAFMLVYPDQPHVRLKFGNAAANYVGMALTFVGLLILSGSFARLRREKAGDEGKPRNERRPHPYPLPLTARARGKLPMVFWSGILFSLISLGISAGWIRYTHSAARLGQAHELKAQKKFAEAMRIYERIARGQPVSNHAEYALYHLATIPWIQQDWKGALAGFERLLSQFSDSRFRAEAWYHLAISHEMLGEMAERNEWRERLARDYPQSTWMGYLRQRWPDWKPRSQRPNREPKR